jgi:segregation and condensation protein B
LETLAIVAYRQPIMRADLEVIRGVDCRDSLQELMVRGLVRISGRDESLGRPILYSTTKRFLQLFGLRDLSDLPSLETAKK